MVFLQNKVKEMNVIYLDVEIFYLDFRHGCHFYVLLVTVKNGFKTVLHCAEFFFINFEFKVFEKKLN